MAAPGRQVTSVLRAAAMMAPCVEGVTVRSARVSRGGRCTSRPTRSRAHPAASRPSVVRTALARRPCCCRWPNRCAAIAERYGSRQRRSRPGPRVFRPATGGPDARSDAAIRVSRGRGRGPGTHPHEGSVQWTQRPADSGCQMIGVRSVIATRCREPAGLRRIRQASWDAILIALFRNFGPCCSCADAGERRPRRTQWPVYEMHAQTGERRLGRRS